MHIYAYKYIEYMYFIILYTTYYTQLIAGCIFKHQIREYIFFFNVLDLHTQSIVIAWKKKRGGVLYFFKLFPFHLRQSD